MKEPPIDFKKLRSGEEVKCPECQDGIYRTESHDPKKAQYFECDKCGLTINYD